MIRKNKLGPKDRVVELFSLHPTMISLGIGATGSSLLLVKGLSFIKFNQTDLFHQQELTSDLINAGVFLFTAFFTLINYHLFNVPKAEESKKSETIKKIITLSTLAIVIIVTLIEIRTINTIYSFYKIKCS